MTATILSIAIPGSRRSN